MKFGIYRRPTSGESAWGGGSVNRRILSATTTITGLVILVKAASLAKEMIIARRFGAGDSLDAFYIAFLVPSFLVSIVDTSFSAAFVPFYVEAREKEKDAANRLFSSVAAFNIVMLAIVATVLGGSQRWLLPLLGSGFGAEKLKLARPMFFAFSCSLLLSGLAVLWRAALSAHEYFALTSIATITTPFSIIFMLLVAGHAWGIYALVAGSILGVVGELAVVGYGLWSIGIPLLPRWYGFDSWMRRVVWQYAPMVAGALVMGCGTTLVDPAMAAVLGSGSVSSLNYAYKLPALVLNVGLTSLSIVMLPCFSRLSAREDWRGMRQVLLSYTSLIACVTIPLTALLIVLSKPLVSFFFQGGAFSSDDVDVVARVQAMFCLEIPFYSVAILYVRAVSSLKCNQILMWGSLINVSANIVLNVLFIRIMGLPGIALSTSAVYAISCGYLWLMLFRLLRQRETTGAGAIDLRIVPSEASME